MITGTTTIYAGDEFSYCTKCFKVSDDIWECCNKTMKMLKETKSNRNRINKKRQQYLREQKLNRILK
jgi:hypothetical protein